jgi:hypothetical protein
LYNVILIYGNIFFLSNFTLLYFFRGKKITLLYEHCDEDLKKLDSKNKIPNIKHKKILNKNAFGHQHRSVLFCKYKFINIEHLQ